MTTQTHRRTVKNHRDNKVAELKAEIKRLNNLAHANEVSYGRFVFERDHYRRQWSEGQAKIAQLLKIIDTAKRAINFGNEMSAAYDALCEADEGNTNDTAAVDRPSNNAADPDA